MDSFQATNNEVRHAYYKARSDLAVVENGTAQRDVEREMLRSVDILEYDASGRLVQCRTAEGERAVDKRSRAAGMNTLRTWNVEREDDDAPLLLSSQLSCREGASVAERERLARMSGRERPRIRTSTTPAVAAAAAGPPIIEDDDDDDDDDDDAVMESKGDDRGDDDEVDGMSDLLKHLMIDQAAQFTRNHILKDALWKCSSPGHTTAAQRTYRAQVYYAEDLMHMAGSAAGDVSLTRTSLAFFHPADTDTNMLPGPETPSMAAMRAALMEEARSLPMAGLCSLVQVAASDGWVTWKLPMGHQRRCFPLGSNIHMATIQPKRRAVPSVLRRRRRVAVELDDDMMEGEKVEADAFVAYQLWSPVYLQACVDKYDVVSSASTAGEDSMVAAMTKVPLVTACLMQHHDSTYRNQFSVVVCLQNPGDDHPSAWFVLGHVLLATLEVHEDLVVSAYRRYVASAASKKGKQRKTTKRGRGSDTTKRAVVSTATIRKIIMDIYMFVSSFEPLAVDPASVVGRPTRPVAIVRSHTTASLASTSASGSGSGAGRGAGAGAGAAGVLDAPTWSIKAPAGVGREEAIKSIARDMAWTQASKPAHVVP